MQLKLRLHLRANSNILALAFGKTKKDGTKTPRKLGGTAQKKTQSIEQKKPKHLPGLIRIERKK